MRKLYVGIDLGCKTCAGAVRDSKGKLLETCGFPIESVPQPNSKIAKITHDIKIGDQLAFTAGEQIQIESISPDPNQPENKYIVLSKNLNKRFRLSDGDISVS
jgi:hypothetical protein